MNYNQHSKKLIKIGKPGIILAQIRESTAEVYFLDHEPAKEIIEVLRRHKKGGSGE